MSIVITGNPGVGKHTITEKIADRLKLPVLDINTIAKDSGLFEQNQGTNDIDTEKLGKIFEQKISGKNIIVGHLAPYVLHKNKIKIMIVLRRNPYDLISVYKKRKYSDKKIKEINVEDQKASKKPLYNIKKTIKETDRTVEKTYEIEDEKKDEDMDELLHLEEYEVGEDTPTQPSSIRHSRGASLSSNLLMFEQNRNSRGSQNTLGVNPQRSTVNQNGSTSNRNSQLRLDEKETTEKKFVANIKKT